MNVHAQTMNVNHCDVIPTFDLATSTAFVAVNGLDLAVAVEKAIKSHFFTNIYITIWLALTAISFTHQSGQSSTLNWYITFIII